MEKAWDQWLDGYHRKPRGLRSCPSSGVKFLLPPVNVNTFCFSKATRHVHLNSVSAARRGAFVQLGTAQRRFKCFSASLPLVAASQLRRWAWLAVNLDTAIRG